jgi:nicotinamidase-related amidase
MRPTTSSTPATATSAPSKASCRCPASPSSRRPPRTPSPPTGLQALLTTEGIRHLIVTGIQTELCCETTTRVAGDLGYDVTFVTEATATFPIPHRDEKHLPYDEILASPRTLSTDDVIARTEYALAGRFATIATVKELIG